MANEFGHRYAYIAIGHMYRPIHNDVRCELALKSVAYCSNFKKMYAS